MLQLKGYQEKALESLRIYLRACDTLQDANLAFYQVTSQLWERGIPYRPIKEPSELADIPYVCLRLPTGGGKTLLACHAVGVSNKEYLKKENSLVLWLVPSNAIREQTLNALRDRNHDYRQALDTSVGRVTVMDLSEALYLQAGALLGSTVIVVATLQAFRVEDREGRKVYESSGALQHHFESLPSLTLENLDHDENSVAPYSLANLCGFIVPWSLWTRRTMPGPSFPLTRWRGFGPPPSSNSQPRRTAAKIQAMSFTAPRQRS